MKKKIGIIDSGVGGLTVVKEVMRQLPNESILYFGDTKRCPYGDRNESEIKKFTLEMVEFIKQYDLKAIVIACNTATVIALDDVMKNVDIPVIGVVEPGVQMALNQTINNRIGVIGTTATINSGVHKEKLLIKNPNLKVVSIATPKLAPTIEKGDYNEQKLKEMFDIYFKKLKQSSIDTLILGCTHYPLIHEQISGYLGSSVKLINPAITTVKTLKNILSLNNLLEKEKLNDDLFFVSGSSESTQMIAERWLKRKITIKETVLN